MATKKEKREAAQAKREKFEQDVKQSGLQAQALDQARRERVSGEIAMEAKALNDRYNEILHRHGIPHARTLKQQAEHDAYGERTKKKLEDALRDAGMLDE